MKCLLTTSLIIALTACTAFAKKKEVTDPEIAKADPDFAVQGEYVGEGELPEGKSGKIAAQVVAQGDGKFKVVLFEGGLPGDGWKRGDKQVSGEAARDGEEIKITMGEGGGTIAEGTITITDKDGNTKGKLERTERTSPTIGAKPPEGAVVLFDGTTAENFEHGKLSEHKTLWAGVTTKQGFNDMTLHLELMTSWMPAARGQGRSNSGLYLHDCYECQVLDSFGLDGKDNECGGIYKIAPPAVNMCFPPMTWQTYDIEFTAPKYDGDKKVSNARATIRHNGVVIHDDLELPNGTPGRKPEGAGPRPFHLQGHGNKVQYRNIWVKEK